MKHMKGKCESVQLEVRDNPLWQVQVPTRETELTPFPTKEATPLCRTHSAQQTLDRKIFKEAGCATAAAESDKGKKIKLI